MTRVTTVVPQFLLLVGIIAGTPTQALAQTNTEMIVGGEEVKDGQYPWQVRLYASFEDEIGFCGGSIIDDQWILTAAHCVLDTKPEAVVVGYGNVDRTKTTKVPAEKIIVHPGYIAGEKADLALIKLSKPIPNAAKISYIDRAQERSAMPAGAKVTVSGWGAIWDFPAFQNAIKVMAGRSMLSERKLLSDNELQAPRKLHKVDIELINTK